MKKSKLSIMLFMAVVVSLGFSVVNATTNQKIINNSTYDANTRYIGSYNVVAFENVLAEQSSVEGAIAVRNKVEAPLNIDQNYTIGTAYSQSRFQHIGVPFNEKVQPVLLLEKDQNSNGLFVLEGDVVMSTTSTYSNVSSAYNKYLLETSEIEGIFDKWQEESTSFINTVKKFKVGNELSGGSTNSSMGKFTFNEITNVNNTAVSVLPIVDGVSHINEFNITPEVNTNEYIVMYSDAQEVTFGSSWGAAMYNNQIINFNQLYNNQKPIVSEMATKIVFVFPNATKVNIKNYSVPGSIVAPNAHIEGFGGSINGQVITKTLSQNTGFDIHNFRFKYLDADAEKFDFNDVTTGTITAQDFNICFCDLQKVTMKQLITLANANAYDSDGNLLRIEEVDSSQLTSQTVDGVYPVTFKSSDGQEITVNATLFHKNYTVNANDVTITDREFYQLSKKEFIDMFGLNVTSPTGVVNSNDYAMTYQTTLKMNSKVTPGVYPVKIIIDDCFEKDVNVTITEHETNVPNGFIQNEFSICFCDAGIFSDEQLIKLANIREYNPETGKYEHVTNIESVDRSSLDENTTKGVYPIFYKTEDNKTFEVDAYVYSKNYKITAHNIRYEKSDFNPNTINEVLIAADYKVYDPNNEKFLTMDDASFEYTTTLVSNYETVYNDEKLSVIEYRVDTSVDTCYKSGFNVYVTEKIVDPVEPVDPIDPVDPVVPVEPTNPINPVSPTVVDNQNDVTKDTNTVSTKVVLPQTGEKSYVIEIILTTFLINFILIKFSMEKLD